MFLKLYVHATEMSSAKLLQFRNILTYKFLSHCELFTVHLIQCSECSLLQIWWLFLVATSVRLPLRPWLQSKVSLCWWHLSPDGINNHHATTDSVLEWEVHPYDMCVQGERGKSSAHSAEKNQHTSNLLPILNFTCLRRSLFSKNTPHQFRTVSMKTEPLNLQVLFARRQSMHSLFQTLWHRICFFFPVCFLQKFSCSVKPLQQR